MKLIGEIYGRGMGGEALRAVRATNFHLFQSTTNGRGDLVLITDQGRFKAPRQFTAEKPFTLVDAILVDFENHTTCRIPVSPRKFQEGDTVSL